MPAGGLLTPKAGVPHEDLSLGGAKHDQNQHDGGSWVKKAKITPSAPENSAAPRKRVNPLLMPILLLRSSALVMWAQPLDKKTIPSIKRRRGRLRSVETGEIRKEHCVQPSK